MPGIAGDTLHCFPANHASQGKAVRGTWNENDCSRGTSIDCRRPASLLRRWVKTTGSFAAATRATNVGARGKPNRLATTASIAEIAAECGLSSSYFAKAFKQATGSPPHAWLAMKRIERAKQLLTGTNDDLAEIALACGFVDQSHLGRAFQKHEGCSPGRWRRFRNN